MNDFVKALEQIRKEAKEGRLDDPLVHRGIPRDYVCVINPAMMANLLEISRQVWGEGFKVDAALIPEPLQLEIVLGRAVWVFDEAPLDAIEFMDQAELRARYPAAMRREDEARAELAARKDSDHAPGLGS